MKTITAMFLAMLVAPAVKAEDSQQEKAALGHWMMSYYQKPTPEKVSSRLTSATKLGMFKKESAHPPIIVFLSRVMEQNPKLVAGWMKEFENLDEKQREVFLIAAWYSDTEASRNYFQEKQLQEYLENEPPDLLKLEMNTPSRLDMMWGYFFATGKIEPIRRIVSSLELAKYSGAMERYRDSKMKKDKTEALYEVTFRAAMWSLESNCQQHSAVLKHCKTIYAEAELPELQREGLGVLLLKLEPDDSKEAVEVGSSS